jgi:outer membrane protein assembly factor BamB
VNPGVTHFSSNLLTLSVVAASIDAVAYQINPGHSGVMQFSSVTLPGSSAWSASLGGPPSYALIAGGRVYVSTEIGSPGSTITWKLFAFNGKDGSVAWGPLTFSGAVGLAYDGGKLFVTSGQYFQSAVLSALDPATGNTLWSVTVPNPESFASGGPPVAAQGIVYTQETGYVTAFDETTGTQLWQSENFSGTSGSIAVGLDGVYSSGPCTAFDFRPLTGETIWDATTGCDGGGGITPVLGYGRLYAPLAVVTNNTTPYSGNIYGAGTGSLLGNFAYGNSPAVSPSNTYAVTGGTLQSVSNTTGLVNWSFAGDQGLQTAPIIVNNDLFVGSSSGNLYTLDATSGTLLGTLNLGAAIPQNIDGNTFVPATGLSAGDGLLIVPAGNSINAFVLSTTP